MKIIFLDIDGPMIPLRSYIWDRNASWKQLLDPMCVKVLRAVIDETGAKIVFNTTHNTMLEATNSSPGLIARFVEHGFKDDLHEDLRTIYPATDRKTSIMEWLHRHPTETWVAFDDAKIVDERAFLTDATHGIGWNEYQHARKHLLGEEPKIVLI